MRERVARSGEQWHWIEDQGEGFDFGAHPDPRAGESDGMGYEFRLGDTRAEGRIFPTGSRDQVYVGVLPDPLPYLDRIQLPDGRDGHDVAEHVTVEGELVLLRAEAEVSWEKAIVEVVTTVPEHHRTSHRHPRHLPMAEYIKVPASHPR